METSLPAEKVRPEKFDKRNGKGDPANHTSTSEITNQEMEMNLKNESNRIPLHTAVFNGNYEETMLILRSKPNINEIDDIFEWQPILIAAVFQDWKIVELLLKEKADESQIYEVIKLTKSLLHEAVEESYLEIAKLLIKLKPDCVNFAINYKTPLHIATKNRNLDMVDLLLRKKARILAKDNDGITPIHECAINGDCEVLKKLIGENTSYLNTKDNFFRTPLHLAVENGNYEMVETLINMGSEINAVSGLLYRCQSSNWTPLHIASAYGKEKIVRLLIEKGADMSFADNRNHTALDLATDRIILKIIKDKYLLRHAILCNDLDTIREVLLRNPAWTNEIISDRTPLYVAAREGHLEMTEYLLGIGANMLYSNSHNMTPLRAASHNGKLNTVRFLLSRGADPAYGDDSSGWTTLHDAAQAETPKMIEFYFSEEFNDKDWANLHDLNGVSLLHAAALAGRHEIVQILLKNGAKPNALDGVGYTPAFAALSKCHTEVAKTIVRHGGFIPADELEGGDLMIKLKVTPLHMAALYGNMDMVKYLLEDLDVDVNSGWGDGMTPLHCAALFNRNKDIMDYLLANNADLLAEIDARRVVRNIDDARWPKKDMEKEGTHSFLKKNVRFLKALAWCIHGATPVDFYECFRRPGEEMPFRWCRPRGFLSRLRVKIVKTILSFDLVEGYWRDINTSLERHKTKNNHAPIGKN